MPLCMISYSEVMCAVHVKYCNHLLAVDMAVWHVYRGLWMGVRKGTVVSFVPTLFGYFLGIPSL